MQEFLQKHIHRKLQKDAVKLTDEVGAAVRVNHRFPQASLPEPSTPEYGLEGLSKLLESSADLIWLNLRFAGSFHRGGLSLSLTASSHFYLDSLGGPDSAKVGPVDRLSRPRLCKPEGMKSTKGMLGLEGLLDCGTLSNAQERIEWPQGGSLQLHETAAGCCSVLEAPWVVCRSVKLQSGDVRSFWVRPFEVSGSMASHDHNRLKNRGTKHGTHKHYHHRHWGWNQLSLSLVSLIWSGVASILSYNHIGILLHKGDQTLPRISCFSGWWIQGPLPASPNGCPV